MSIIQQCIPGDYNYIDVAANDIDYAVIKQGLSALSNMDRSKYNVFDSSQNYTSVRVLQAIADSMEHCGIPGVVLGSDPRLTTERIRYFPHFALYGINDWVNEPRSQEPVYLYSCLNRNPHLHRILNWYALKDIPGGYWSMYNLEGYTYNFTHAAWQQDCVALPTTCKNDLTSDHVAYKSSYINLVTETVMHNTVFVSEKTWKPIANAQLFLVAGCQGTISYLRSIGVDVFDDVIDHSYDHEPDWQRRLEQVHVSFKKLITKDIAAIWSRTQDRRQQNAQHFFNKSFVNLYVEQLRDSI